MPLRPVGGLCNLKWHACCILMTEVYESLSLKTNERKQKKEQSIFFFFDHRSIVHLLSVLLAVGAMYFCKHLERPYLKSPLTSQGFLCCCSLNPVHADLSYFMQMPAGARLLGEFNTPLKARAFWGSFLKLSFF